MVATLPEWLQANYGITEEEDVVWLDILNYHGGDWDIAEELKRLTPGRTPEELAEMEQHLHERERFLRDEPAVLAFLEQLLIKYRRGTAVYPTTS